MKILSDAVFVFSRGVENQMTSEDFRALLSVDPKIITGVLVALGARELLQKFVERYWAKQDEEQTDHKLISEAIEKLNDIQKQLDQMEENGREGLENDILLLEHNILFLQRKAIDYKKVSKGCMPRYRMLFKRYKALTEKSNLEINEEAETNNEIVEKMFRDGHVVDSFWEMQSKD